jgi:hypothetical protein
MTEEIIGVLSEEEIAEIYGPVMGIENLPFSILIEGITEADITKVLVKFLLLEYLQKTNELLATMEFKLQELIASFTSANLENELSTEESKRVMVLLESEEFQLNVESKIKEILLEYAYLMLDMVKSLCPVKTGALRDSLDVVVHDDGVSIVSDLYYFGVVESRVGFVQAVYDIYEPQMLEEIDNVILEMVTVK